MRHIILQDLCNLPCFCKRSHQYLNILKYLRTALLCILYEWKKEQEGTWEPADTPPPPPPRQTYPQGPVPKGMPLWLPLHVSSCSAKPIITLSLTGAALGPCPPLSHPALSLCAGARGRDQYCCPDSHPSLSRPGKATVLRLVGGWETKNGFPASISSLPLSLLFASRPAVSPSCGSASGFYQPAATAEHHWPRGWWLELQLHPLVPSPGQWATTLPLLKPGSYSGHQCASRQGHSLFPTQRQSAHWEYVEWGSCWNARLAPIQLQFCSINMFLPTTQEVPVSSRGFWLPLGLSDSQMRPDISSLCSASALGTLVDNRQRVLSAQERMFWWSYLISRDKCSWQSLTGLVFVTQYHFLTDFKLFVIKKGRGMSLKF